MDKWRNRRWYIAVPTILLTITAACVLGPAVSRHTQNEEIEEEIRREIHVLNDAIVGSLISGDSDEIFDLFVEDVQTRPEFLSQLELAVEQIGPALSGTEMAVFHEIDAKFSGIMPRTSSLVTDFETGFIVHVTTARKRMFVSLLLAKGEHDDKLLGIQYVRDGDAWRVYDLRAGLLRITNMSALDWADKAQRLSERGLAVPAKLHVDVANTIRRPLTYMQFVQDGSIDRVAKAVSRRLAELPGLPLELPEVSSDSTVYAVDSVFVKEQLVPVVRYVSTLEFSDAALRREVSDIALQLDHKFPGLCEGTDNVLYRAFHEAPTDPTREYETFGVVYDCQDDGGQTN